MDGGLVNPVAHISKHASTITFIYLSKKFGGEGLKGEGGQALTIFIIIIIEMFKTKI